MTASLAFRIKSSDRDVAVSIVDFGRVLLEVSEKRPGKKGYEWHHAVVRLTRSEVRELAQTLVRITG